MVYIKKFLFIILGLSLVTVGVLGMILPILHGTIFLISGLVILSFESEYIEQRLLQLVEKNKTAKRWHKKVDLTLRGWFKK